MYEPVQPLVAGVPWSHPTRRFGYFELMWYCVGGFQKESAYFVSFLSPVHVTGRNTNRNTKYTCATCQTNNKLLEQWMHQTKRTAGYSHGTWMGLTAPARNVDGANSCGIASNIRRETHPASTIWMPRHHIVVMFRCAIWYSAAEATQKYQNNYHAYVHQCPVNPSC